MKKVFFAIFLSLLPMIFLMGVSRVVLLGYPTNEFVPTPLEFVNMFNSMPDFMQLTRDSFDKANQVILKFDGLSVSSLSSVWNLSPITDIGSFFNAFGEFFKALGETFKWLGSCLATTFELIWCGVEMVFNFVSIPVRFMVWLFSSLFKPYSNVS